jgi:hypothetical protein
LELEVELGATTLAGMVVKVKLVAAGQAGIELH